MERQARGEPGLCGTSPTSGGFEVGLKWNQTAGLGG